MRPIVIKIGDVVVEAELNQSKTARLVWEILPIEANAQTWGEEIYFTIPLDAALESPRATVNVGDLGYWPTGHAFCIFYGRTPLSGEDEVVPASPVDVIGHVTSDMSALKGIADPGRVTVERGM